MISLLFLPELLPAIVNSFLELFAARWTIEEERFTVILPMILQILAIVKSLLLGLDRQIVNILQLVNVPHLVNILDPIVAPLLPLLELLLSLFDLFLPHVLLLSLALFGLLAALALVLVGTRH